MTYNKVKYDMKPEFNALNVNNDLDARENRLMCPMAEAHIIASLLIQRYNAKFRDHFVRAGLDVPYSLLQAAFMVYDRDIWIQKGDDPRTKTGIRVPHILMKRGVGESTGVVTTGTYAGLLVREVYGSHERPARPIMLAGRLWFNGNGKVPFTQEVPEMIKDPRYYQEVLDNDQRITQLVAAYRQLLRDWSKNASGLWSEQLAVLCRACNFPIDEHAFQFSV